MKKFVRCIPIGICLGLLQFSSGMTPASTTNQTLLRWETDIDRIEVVSESGQRVLTYNVAGLQQKIVDMSHLQSGIYFVRFLSENSIVTTKKLIKR